MNKEEPSLPNIAVSALAVTGGLVIMVVIVAIAYLPNRPDTVARPGMSPEERRELLEEKRERDRAELAEYGWINRNQGRIRLPIDRAIELAVAEIEEEGTIAVEEFAAPEEEDAAEEEEAAENGEAEDEQEESSEQDGESEQDGDAEQNGEAEQGAESGADEEAEPEDNADADASGEGGDNGNDNEGESAGAGNG